MSATRLRWLIVLCDWEIEEKWAYITTSMGLKRVTSVFRAFGTVAVAIETFGHSSLAPLVVNFCVCAGHLVYAKAVDYIELHRVIEQ